MTLYMSIYALSHAFKEKNRHCMITISQPKTVQNLASLSNYYHCKEIQYDAEQHDELCSISMEAFQHNDILVELPCLHYFSTSSITKWLEISSNCPVCRQKVKSI